MASPLDFFSGHQNVPADIEAQILRQLAGPPPIRGVPRVVFSDRAALTEAVRGGKVPLAAPAISELIPGPATPVDPILADVLPLEARQALIDGYAAGGGKFDPRRADVLQQLVGQRMAKRLLAQSPGDPLANLVTEYPRQQREQLLQNILGARARQYYGQR